MTDETKNLGGRPRKEIDMDTLTKLAVIHCTAEECAAFFDVDADTLDARLKEDGWAGFSEFHKTHSGVGKISLRRAQWLAATEDRNPTMMIWLGKQMLGQTDKQTLEHTGAGGGPIQTEDVTRDCDAFARRVADLAARNVASGDGKADPGTEGAS